MKPSVREYFNGEYTVQELRGFKLYSWQCRLLNLFGGNFNDYKVYFRN